MPSFTDREMAASQHLTSGPEMSGIVSTCAFIADPHHAQNRFSVVFKTVAESENARFGNVYFRFQPHNDKSDQGYNSLKLYFRSVYEKS
jgi:hypothetical protein